MNFSNPFKNSSNNDDDSVLLQNDAEVQTMALDAADEEISLGTKIKVVAALVITAFATYIAFWVQEPADIQVNVLNSEIAQEQAQPEAIAIEEALETATLNGTEQSSEPLKLTFSDEAAGEQSPLFAAEGDENVVEVLIQNFAFMPANIPVTAGTTVVWTNADTVAHTVTADSFSSEMLEPGDSFSYTFRNAGTFSYFCSVHPQMIGSIKVEGAAGAQSPLLLNPVDAGGDEEEAAAAAAAAAQAAAEAEAAAPVPAEELSPAAVETAEEVTPLIVLEPESVNAADSLDYAIQQQQPAQLAQTGPAETLYMLVFAAILYAGRNKLKKVFSA